MDLFTGVDWAALFSNDVPILEIVVRGTVIYWLLFLIFRFVIPREVGSIGIADILILVIIADASQNAISGEYKTLTDGIVLITVLVAWNVAIDRLGYYSPTFRRFTTSSTLCLVRDGKLLRRNMRREFVTEEELKSHLRLEGVESIDEVKHVYLEPDGGFSVVKKDRGN